MTPEEILKLIDIIEDIENKSDEEVMNLMCTILIAEYGHLTTREFILTILKPWMAQNTESLRAWFDIMKKKVLEELSQSLKQRRRETHITRK